MSVDQDCQCLDCGAVQASGSISCPRCGAIDPRVAVVCPSCLQVYPHSFSHCTADGSALVEPQAIPSGWARVGGAGPDESNDSPPILTGDFVEKSKQFWNRHTILVVLTMIAVVAGLIGGFSKSGGWMLIATGIGFPLLLSWPIAMASSAKALSFVGWVDKWYFRLHAFFDDSDSRISRWVMYPVVWAGGKWAVFASRRGDRFVAGSLRMFGYTLAAMLLIMLAIITVYIVIGLILLAGALWLMSVIFDTDTGGGASSRTLTMVGRRGQNIYKGGGGWFETDQQIGRVDKDGNIYETDGGWFTPDKQVGRIGKDGEIYETDGGWFTPDKQVGRIGKDGEIYETDGGWFTPDKQVGRMGPDGEVYETDGGWFTPDKRVGKTKRD